ncbi:MAG: hypothetical protein NT052_00665 [Candidatus Shapirobacteria bacterium]|nr:hypothetical protein [Candidatus Shapirobacteria bacterium]
MVNKELLIIETSPLSKSARKHIRLEKSLGHSEQAHEYYLGEINSPKKIKKREMNILGSIEEVLGNDLDYYKKLSLPEIEKNIIEMEGFLTSERQPSETTENFILKAWKEEKGSKKVNLYLWLLSKVHPQELNDLMIVDEKNRNKIFLLRDQAIFNKKHR